MAVVLSGYANYDQYNIHTQAGTMLFTLAYARARKRFHPGIAAIQLARGDGSEPLQKVFALTKTRMQMRENASVFVLRSCIGHFCFAFTPPFVARLLQVQNTFAQNSF